MMNLLATDGWIAGLTIGVAVAVLVIAVILAVLLWKAETVGSAQAEAETVTVEPEEEPAAEEISAAEDEPAPVEEVVVAAVEEEEPDENEGSEAAPVGVESGEAAAADFGTFSRSEQKTFEEKLGELSEQSQDLYERLNKSLTAYAGVKCRRSKRFESYLVKGVTKARIAVAGKTLKLYLALDPAQYDTNVYHHKDAGDKKTYASVPMALKIKSNLAVKKAERLLEILLGQEQ